MHRLFTVGLLSAAVASCGGKEGPQGPQGPQGTQGPQGPGFMGMASINSVVPSAVTQGGEYDVTISGFDTDWADSASVSFGMGISVIRTKAASTTSLLVHIRVAPDAKPDVRDVTVTQGSSTVKWINAFNVLDRVKFSTFGTASQLSLSVVRLAVNEPQFEFDTSTSSGAFLGVSATASPEFQMRVLSVSSKVVDLLVMPNADAGTEAHDVTVISREGTFAERRFTASQIFTVTPAQTMPILEGVPVNGNIDQPYQSATYKYDEMGNADGGTGDTLVVSVQSSAATLNPRVAVLPTSGDWNDMLSFKATSTVSVPAGESLYLVVWEPSGAINFAYTLSVTALPKSMEEEPDDDPGMAKTVPVPGVVAGADLSSISDIDWYKVTVATADVGKKLHVVTQPGDIDTDTVVEVFQPDMMTSLTGLIDHDWHEDVLTPAIGAAGEYYVKISMSSAVFSWSANRSHYNLLITLE